MKNLPELAEHIASLCVGAMAMGGAAATGLSAVAVPLAVLGAIGFQLRGSCARRGGLQAARSVTEALARAGELRSEDVERALDLMKSTDVARTIRPFDMAAAARDLPAGADVNALLATPLADSLTEPGDPIHVVLVIALSGAIAVLRQDEDFHRGLTQELLIAILRGQGLLMLSHEDIRRQLDALQRDYHTIAAALENYQRLQRDEMEAIASRFEILRAYNLSDAQLREELELRAEDYRRHRAEIEAIDEHIAELGALKAAAREAVERLDFREVEALLSQVHTAELDIAAKTALLRANNALLRGRSEQAFELLSAASDSFRVIDRLEPARRLIDYEDILYFHGQRYGGASLAFAERMLRRALEDITEENAPELWARAQSNLGNVLRLEASRVGGPESAKLLIKAAQAYKAAQRVWTEDKAPEFWAVAQNNLSTTVFSQSMQVGGSESIQLLHSSANIASEAARVWLNAGNFEQFARAQTNFGNARAASGAAIGGAEGVQILSEAVEAFRGALRIRTKAKYPLERAHTQHNLGNALQDQGSRVKGPEGDQMLREAVQVLNEALLSRTQAEYPLYWAMTQHSLGNALATQGERTAGQKGVELFTKAIEAFKAALRVHTEAEHPMPWASATRNLGYAHESLADHKVCANPRVALEAAAEHFTEALRVYDPEAMPHDHAKTTAALARVRAKLAALPDPA
jgi:hypothetical protein